MLLTGKERGLTCLAFGSTLFFRETDFWKTIDVVLLAPNIH